MRGRPPAQPTIWYAINIEELIAEDHPLRAVKRRADQALRALRDDLERAYSRIGRPSIPPEMILKALLLQVLYPVRSERRLVEEIRLNLLYRWFLDLSLDAPVWDATVFTKNRERFERYGLLPLFFGAALGDDALAELERDEEFTVNRALLERYRGQGSLSTIRAEVELVLAAAGPVAGGPSGEAAST